MVATGQLAIDTLQLLLINRARSHSVAGALLGRWNLPDASELLLDGQVVAPVDAAPAEALQLVAVVIHLLLESAQPAKLMAYPPVDLTLQHFDIGAFLVQCRLGLAQLFFGSFQLAPQADESLANGFLLGAHDPKT